MYKKIISVIMMGFVLCCMCGCGAKQESSSEGNPVNDASMIATMEQEMSEEQATELEDVPEESQVQESSGEAEMEAWLNELGKQGISLAVWNETNGTKHVIETSEAYVLEEGDRFFVTTPSKIHSIGTFFQYEKDWYHLEKPQEYYMEISFKEQIQSVVEFEIECSGGQRGIILCKLYSSEPEYNFMEEGECCLKKTWSIDDSENQDYSIDIMKFNIPEGYSVSEQVGPENCISLLDSQGGRLEVIYDLKSDIYEGVNLYQEYDGYNIEYVEVGSVDTPYGKAKNFDILSDYGDGNIGKDKVAIIYIDGFYVQIYYYNIYISHDVGEEFIELLQQMFE